MVLTIVQKIDFVFWSCLAMKGKEKTFITRNVYHGLQLSAQANVTPCNLREKILAVFCQDVGLLSSAIGSQLGWHEKETWLWSNRWVVPNFYYFWHENYRDSIDWVVRWSSEFLNVFSMLLRDGIFMLCMVVLAFFWTIHRPYVRAFSVHKVRENCNFLKHPSPLCPYVI